MQDPDEALEGAHQRPVDHHRPVLGVVGAGVGEVEALGQVVVELDGAELPRAAERVGHVQVDLRAVERAVALVDVVLEALATRARCAAPPRRGPTARRSRCARSGRVESSSADVEAEHLVGGERELQAAGDLVLRSAPRCRRCARRPGRSGARASARAASRWARGGAAAPARSSAPAGRGRSGAAALNSWQCPGQFIGFSAIGWSSTR